MSALENNFSSDELSSLLEKYPQFKMMDWESARELNNTGISMESHGHYHELHHPAQDLETQLQELTLSREIIREKLNKECKLFAYPNGSNNKLSPILLRENGYENAFTTNSGFVQNFNNPFLLNRISPNNKPYKFRNSLYVQNIS
jgi:hypothetical protein